MTNLLFFGETVRKSDAENKPDRQENDLSEKQIVVCDCAKRRRQRENRRFFLKQKLDREHQHREQAHRVVEREQKTHSLNSRKGVQNAAQNRDFCVSDELFNERR